MGQVKSKQDDGPWIVITVWQDKPKPEATVCYKAEDAEKCAGLMRAFNATSSIIPVKQALASGALLDAASRAAEDFRQFRPDTNGTLKQLEAAIALTE